MPKIRHFLPLFVFSLALATGAYSQTALQFNPITPCRLLDTRQSQPLMGGQTLPVQVQGACGIPSSAMAYSFNVTVVPHGSLNYLTVWPAGQTRPVVSTLNSYDGRTKAVAAIIPAGTPSGEIDAYATNTTDLILDIDGYFVSSTNSTLGFYSLPPCRLYDTRGGNYIHAMQTVTFALLNLCGIPSNAEAYSLNFTALPRTHSLNYLTAWPAGQPQPGTSTLNAPTGAVTANAALVQGGASGEISVFSYNDTDLLIDVNGYFAAPGQSNQLALYTLPPCRVLDTRPNYFTGAITVHAESSPCSVPSTAQAYVVNATVVPQTRLGYLTLWPDGQQPVVSTLNAYDGAVTSNLAIVPADTANGTFQAYASSNTNLLIDIFSYMGAAPLGVVPNPLTAIINQPYNAELQGSGGVPPYTWMMTGGSLPPGLSLNSLGFISGTPTSLGLFPFTVQITDSQNNTASGTENLVVETSLYMITTSQLPSGTVSVPYSAALGVSGGVPPYTWSFVSGSLPSGLSLNSSGVISGTPNGSPGVSNFVAQVTDSAQQVLTAALQIGVNPALGNFSLTGNYAFAINGYQNGNMFFLAGSLVSDGHGNITSGLLDLNTGSGSPSAGTGFTGTYSLGGNGVGTMSLNAVGISGPLNFHFVLAANGQGQIIWDNADPNPRGSGLFLQQNPVDFYPPQPGSFAIGTFGVDSSLNRYAKAGQFTVTTGGVVSSGSEDVNDNGVLGNDTYTGQFSGINTRDGRNLAVFTFNGAVNNYAYYTIRQGHVLIIGIDPLSATDPMTLGTILVQQTSAFSKGSLQGATILNTTALAPNDGSPLADVVLGLGTWDGNGNGGFSLDENRGGTMLVQSSTGTYNVAANGRTTLSGFGGNPPLLYLANFDQGFLLGQDNSVAFGNLLQQTARPPFGNASILGTYLGGTLEPSISAIVDSVGYLLADGNGNFNGMGNTSAPSGTGTVVYSASYQVDSTGRAVVTGTPGGFMYVVSPSEVMLLPNGNTPALNIFNTGLTN